MNKQDYDPRKARFDLCESIIMDMAAIQRKIKNARDNELAFASNETIYTDDLDKLWKEASDLLQNVIAMGTDNLQ